MRVGALTGRRQCTSKSLASIVRSKPRWRCQTERFKLVWEYGLWLILDKCDGHGWVLLGGQQAFHSSHFSPIIIPSGTPSPAASLGNILPLPKSTFDKGRAPVITRWQLHKTGRCEYKSEYQVHDRKEDTEKQCCESGEVDQSLDVRTALLARRLPRSGQT
jgi:hypothetical protein